MTKVRTKVSDIWAAMRAEAADLPVDVEISDWWLDELLFKVASEVRYYSGETEPEQHSGLAPEVTLCVSARPMVVVEGDRLVGRWRVDRFFVSQLGYRRSHKLGYFGTLPEALEAIEAYIREMSDS